MLTFPSNFGHFLALSCLGLSLCALPATAQSKDKKKKPTGDLLKGRGDMEKGSTRAIEWAGVDSSGRLSGMSRSALVVSSGGQVSNVSYPGSVAAGDLTGDGLPDLLLADSNGFFWLYANKGTDKKPEWPTGELLSLWLVPEPKDLKNAGWRQDAGYAPACTRLYLTDFTGDGALDLVLGDYLGNIMFVKNSGSRQVPKFDSPRKIEDVTVSTGPKGRLWGNFLAPVYEDFTGDNRPDLLVGEGTYSANSIWLFVNEGSAATPRFSWDKRVRLIPGMGKEHLTPQPVDWNGDGKMDLIVGERIGNVNIYLNETENPREPKFAEEPIEPKFGTSSRFTRLSAPIPHDLNGDGLFDLVAAQTNNRIIMALNKGKKGAPKFDKPESVKGKNPYPKFKAPQYWETQNPPMQTDFVLKLVGNNQKETTTFEEGFTPPSGSKGKYSLKYESLPPLGGKKADVPGVPSALSNRIRYRSRIKLSPDTKYTVSFWAKGSGISNTTVQLRGTMQYTRRGRQVNFTEIVDKAFSASGGWSKKQVSFTWRGPKDADSKKTAEKPMDFNLDFVFSGKGNLYLDDIKVEPN